MEEVSTSETSFYFNQTTRRYVPEFFHLGYYLFALHFLPSLLIHGGGISRRRHDGCSGEVLAAWQLLVRFVHLVIVPLVSAAVSALISVILRGTR
jgi:hypothetical protein